MSAKVDKAARWELDVRPRWMSIWAAIVAAIVFATAVVAAVLLNTTNTGVYFRMADQVAMVLIGAILASFVLLLTRPRLRAGPEGIMVRNAFGDKYFGWDEYLALSFPKGGSWARVELADYEYVPVLAVQWKDKERAAAAFEKFREIEARYRG